MDQNIVWKICDRQLSLFIHFFLKFCPSTFLISEQEYDPSRYLKWEKPLLIWQNSLHKIRRKLIVMVKFAIC